MRRVLMISVAVVAACKQDAAKPPAPEPRPVPAADAAAPSPAIDAAPPALDCAAIATKDVRTLLGIPQNAAVEFTPPSWCECNHPLVMITIKCGAQTKEPGYLESVTKSYGDQSLLALLDDDLPCVIIVDPGPPDRGEATVLGKLLQAQVSRATVHDLPPAD